MVKTVIIGDNVLLNLEYYDLNNILMKTITYLVIIVLYYRIIFFYYNLKNVLFYITENNFYDYLRKSVHTLEKNNFSKY